MSRSRKKSPVACLVGGSNGKYFRRTAHKAMRARTKAALAHERYSDVPLRMEEVSNIYDYKDWLSYVTSGDSEWLRELAEKQARK